MTCPLGLQLLGLSFTILRSLCLSFSLFLFLSFLYVVLLALCTNIKNDEPGVSRFLSTLAKQRKHKPGEEAPRKEGLQTMSSPRSRGQQAKNKKFLIHKGKKVHHKEEEAAGGGTEREEDEEEDEEEDDDE